MSWHHVEDCPPVVKSLYCWSGTKKDPRRELSTTTIGLSVWRCGNCRALAVTSQGQEPSTPCGKCPK